MLGLAAFLALASQGAAATAAPITEAEQKQLVDLALPRDRPAATTIRLVGPDKLFPGFVTYLVSWPGAAGAGPAIGGYFDVNPQTGDVFVATGCKEASNPRLGRQQHALRQKLHIGPDDYARLRKPGPYCR